MLSCIPVLTQCDLMFTSVIQIAMLVGHDHKLETAMQNTKILLNKVTRVQVDFFQVCFFTHKLNEGEFNSKDFYPSARI